MSDDRLRRESTHRDHKCNEAQASSQLEMLLIQTVMTKRCGLHTVDRLIINFNFKLEWMAVEQKKNKNISV